MTVGYLISVCPSVRTEQLSFHWNNFNEIWYIWIFQEFVDQVQFLLKLTKIMGTLHKDLYSLRQYLAEFFLEREMCKQNL